MGVRPSHIKMSFFFSFRKGQCLIQKETRFKGLGKKRGAFFQFFFGFLQRLQNGKATNTTHSRREGGGYETNHLKKTPPPQLYTL